MSERGWHMWRGGYAIGSVVYFLWAVAAALGYAHAPKLFGLNFVALLFFSLFYGMIALKMPLSDQEAFAFPAGSERD